jgi:uncharacterized protein
MWHFWGKSVLPKKTAPLAMPRLLRRLLRFALWLAVALALGGWFAVENVLPYWPIKPYRQNPEHAAWRIPQGSKPENYGLQAEHLSILTRDSIWLKALYISGSTAGGRATQQANNSTTPQLCLVMIPGISGCKEFFLPTAQYFAQHGISTLLLDQRAHGESGGEYCTFGFREKHDVSSAVDTLLARHPHLRLGVMGHSLGGAVALQALAEDERLQFGIVESTFHSLEAVVEQYGKNYFGVRSPWLARHTLDKAAAIAHFDPYAVKPFESAERIQQPVFMAHGDADERIPLAFGRINFEHLVSPQKEWHTVRGAGHNTMWLRGGEQYREAMMRFLERQGN